MAKKECPVCCEAMTPHKTLSCPLCEYSACVTCHQKYVTSSADDPHCMNCRRRWSRDVMSQLFTKVFLNKTFKVHRENTLMERELAMMPSTQPHVERELQRRRNRQALDEIIRRRNELRQQLTTLNNAYHDLLYQMNAPLEVERRSFVQRCATPNCKGFLSSAWKCEICSMYTCSECNVSKGADRNADHVCSEEDKSTMNVLKTQCRKCPSCAQYIQKVDGCDQMWCVSCHTAFSWRTGTIINGTIHNPHFYEFQQNRNNLTRNVGDIECGGTPHFNDVSRALKSLPKDTYHTFMRIHRLANHIEMEELPRYLTRATEQNNIDLRVRYMLDEITSDQFKTKIQQREKAEEKKREIALIYTMFVQTIAGMFRDMIAPQTYKHNLVRYLEEMEALISYTNTCLVNISKRYDCIVYIITNGKDLQHFGRQ